MTIQLLTSRTLTYEDDVVVQQLISRSFNQQIPQSPIPAAGYNTGRVCVCSLESERSEVYKVGTEPGACHCVTRVPLDNMCRYCALLVSSPTLHDQLINNTPTADLSPSRSVVC